jgi:hypothetical protein
MRSLTIRQPWASLILEGAKRVENRTWRAPLSLIGQRFAVHASAGKPQPEGWPAPADVVAQDLYQLPRGVILGTVQLVACVRFEDLPREFAGDPYAEPGGWCWILDEPRLFSEPVPCKGRLGLWPAPANLPL